MEEIKLNIRHVYGNLRQFIRWVLLSVLVGTAVGLFAVFFAHCLDWAARFREGNPWVLFLLPVGGLVIVGLYKLAHYESNGGTDTVIDSIHTKVKVPLRMAVLIFISTVVTILCGGSVGREGAALQIGGSIGSQIGNWFKFDEKDKKMILMSGMAAGFSALFGTPMAAAIFALEVASVGIMYYGGLVPCICASLVAHQIALAFGFAGEKFSITHMEVFTIVPVLEVVLLAALCAAVSVLFCKSLHYAGEFYTRFFKNTYVRIAAGGVIVILLTLLIGSRDYLGTGMNIIERAIEGEAVPYAFLMKIVFTAFTITAGFKGGEIVPSFFIGATFGCLFGQLLGFSPSLAAGIGMIAVFCGMTNCPITSLFISFELFGFSDAYYFLIAVAVSYMLSGHYGLYHTQTIVYSKMENTFINTKAGH